MPNIDALVYICYIPLFAIFYIYLGLYFVLYNVNALIPTLVLCVANFYLILASIYPYIENCCNDCHIICDIVYKYMRFYIYLCVCVCVSHKVKAKILKCYIFGGYPISTLKSKQYLKFYWWLTSNMYISFHHNTYECLSI